MDAERLRAFLLTLPHAAETMQWGANLVFWVGDKSIGGKMFTLINLDDPRPPHLSGAPSMRSHRMGGIDVPYAAPGLEGLEGVQRSKPPQSRPHPILSYAAGPDRFSELLELDGLVPAPYLARAHWVAVLHWDVFTTAEWQRELRAAHAVIFAKLPPRTRKVLTLPAADQKALIAQRRILTARRPPR
jgi:predicted DNA-binding protein (MmcQ/YjbR family)